MPSRAIAIGAAAIGVAVAPLAVSVSMTASRVVFAAPATSVAARIRGVDPWPGAQAVLRGQIVKLFRARPASGHAPEVTEVGLFADRPHREDDGTWLWRSDHIGVIATLWL